MSKIFICLPTMWYPVDIYYPTLYKKDSVRPGLIFSKGNLVDVDERCWEAKCPLYKQENYIIIDEPGLTALSASPPITSYVSYGTGQKLFSGNIFVISEDCLDSAIEEWFCILGKTIFKTEAGEVPAFRIQYK